MIALVDMPPPPSELDEPSGVRLKYVGDVFEKITGPTSAGCLSHPSKLSVRYASRSGVSANTW